jgi:hypothetical protein
MIGPEIPCPPAALLPQAACAACDEELDPREVEVELQGR